MRSGNSKYYIYISIFLAFAVVFHVLGIIMKYNPNVYIFYFNHVYLSLNIVRGAIFSRISIALGDLIYIFLILYLVFRMGGLVSALLKRTHQLKSIFLLTRYISILYIVFLISWGYNYQKPSLIFPVLNDKQTDIAIISANLVDDINTIDSIISKLNHIRAQIKWFTQEEQYANAAIAAYQKANNAYRVQPLKVSVLGRHIYKLGVSGYFNPLTGEGHMIPDLPLSSYGFVYLHEMAHQIGVASESEANLVAYFVAMNSDEPIFQYTALLRLYIQLIGKIYYQSQAVSLILKSKLSPVVQEDIEEAKRYPFTHNFSIRRYSMSIYEQYLKQLGQHDGLSAYGKLYQQVTYAQQHEIKLSDILWQFN